MPMAESSQTAPDFKTGYLEQEGDFESRNALITENLSLVDLMMHRISPNLGPSTEAEDIMSAGVIGLIDAAQRFDPNRAARFRTYAQIRVRGAILDYLRSLTWAPRAMFSRKRQLEAKRHAFESRVGRNPTMAELADEMGLKIEEQQALLLNLARLRFCDDEAIYERERPMQAAGNLNSREGDPLFEVERKELLAILRESMNCLSERQRLVLWLYYFNELTMKEVGQVLKINEARVSQLHSKAIATLRREMKYILEGDAPQQKKKSLHKSSRKTKAQQPREVC
jgi:RNA polymerase sigma factor for flagellar operon FliA